MLVSSESYAEAASAVPDIVSGVVVYPVGYGQRHAVEEHITGEVLVRLRGHYYHSVVRGLPRRKNHDVPVAVMKVDIVIIITESAGSTADLSGDHLRGRGITGKNDGISGITERLTVFILHISYLDGELGESFLEYCGGQLAFGTGGEYISPKIV